MQNDLFSTLSEPISTDIDVKTEQSPKKRTRKKSADATQVASEDFKPVPKSQPTHMDKPSNNSTTLSVPGGKDADGKFYIYGQSWIVLQNRLLHAISNLSLNERRLILYLSPMIRADVEQFPDKTERIFSVHASDFADHYSMDKSNTYRVLSEAADSILTKAFWFWDFETNRKNPNRRGSTWVDNCVYRNSEGCIDIRLSSLVVEMLTVFDKHNPFTKYKKDWVVHLGRYGIDLFEIMISAAYKKEQSVTYTLEYLREKFDCTDKYTAFTEFKRNVLNPAVKEIESSTPYRIDFTAIREGRSVKKICFNFSYLGNNSTDSAEALDAVDDAVRLEFKGIRVAIPDSIQTDILKLYNNDAGAIEYSIKAANTYIDNLNTKGKEVNNLQGVYITALRENWGLPLFEKEQEAVREAEAKRVEAIRKKEEAERRKREFEQRYDNAYNDFLNLPDSIKEIVLNTVQASLPPTLQTKFEFIRSVNKKSSKAVENLVDSMGVKQVEFYPFMHDEFKEPFILVMEGSYGGSPITTDET